MPYLINFTEILNDRKIRNFPHCAIIGKFPTFGRTLIGMHRCIHAWSCRCVYSQNAVMGVSFHFRLIFKTLPYLVPLIYKGSSSNDFFFLSSEPKEPNKWCCFCLSPTSTPTSYFKSDDYQA